jgi:hypothetical protein
MSSIRLLTEHGIFDVVLAADGVGRFPEWDRSALSVDLAGYQVRVAALSDIIRSKEAAGRPKDLAALPRLRIILDR